MNPSSPPDLSSRVELALERASNAQADADASNQGINTLRHEMHTLFAEMKAHLVKIELQNAKRSGAERLGAWLFGAAAGLGTVIATIWAAMQNSSHH